MNVLFLASVGESIPIIIFLLLLAGMIYHMISVNVKTKQLNTEVSVNYFAEQRAKKGLSNEMTKEEADRAIELLDGAFQCLSVVTKGENGEELRTPGKMKELLQVQKKLDEVTAIMPVDEEIVDQLNKDRAFLYDYLRRSFFASWKLIIVAAIAMGLLSIASWDSNAVLNSLLMTVFFFLPVGIYYLSGNVPQYMIDKKNARGTGGGWFSNILIGMGIGVLFSGQTVVTRTKWSDGTVTEDSDSSSHWIALILGFFILMIIAFTITFWAVVNYLRNYVLYF